MRKVEGTGTQAGPVMAQPHDAPTAVQIAGGRSIQTSNDSLTPTLRDKMASAES